MMENFVKNLVQIIRYLVMIYYLKYELQDKNENF